MRSTKPVREEKCLRKPTISFEIGVKNSKFYPKKPCNLALSELRKCEGKISQHIWSRQSTKMMRVWAKIMKNWHTTCKSMFISFSKLSVPFGGGIRIARLKIGHQFLWFQSSKFFCSQVWTRQQFLIDFLVSNLFLSQNLQSMQLMQLLLLFFKSQILKFETSCSIFQAMKLRQISKWESLMIFRKSKVQNW